MDPFMAVELRLADQNSGDRVAEVGGQIPEGASERHGRDQGDDPRPPPAFAIFSLKLQVPAVDEDDLTGRGAAASGTLLLRLPPERPRPVRERFGRQPRRLRAARGRLRDR